MQQYLLSKLKSLHTSTLLYFEEDLSLALNSFVVWGTAGGCGCQICWEREIECPKRVAMLPEPILGLMLRRWLLKIAYPALKRDEGAPLLLKFKLIFSLVQDFYFHFSSNHGKSGYFEFQIEYQRLRT